MLKNFFSQERGFFKRKLNRAFALASLGVFGFGQLPAPASAEELPEPKNYPESVYNSFRTYGDIMKLGLPLSAFFLTFAKKDKEGRRMLLKSCGLTTLSVEGIKSQFADTSYGIRPDGGERSFPSGHAAGGACGAWFLYDRYGPKHGIPAIIAALGVAASRVDSGKHHERDVLAGFLLARSVSKLMTDPDYSGPTILPFFDRETEGLRFLTTIPGPRNSTGELRFDVFKGVGDTRSVSDAGAFHPMEEVGNVRPGSHGVAATVKFVF